MSGNNNFDTNLPPIVLRWRNWVNKITKFMINYGATLFFGLFLFEFQLNFVLWIEPTVYYWYMIIGGYALMPHTFIGFLKIKFIGEINRQRTEDVEVSKLTDFYGRPVFNPLEGIIIEDFFLGIWFWFSSRVFDFMEFNNFSLMISTFLLFGVNSYNFALYGYKFKKKSMKWSSYAFSFFNWVLATFGSLLLFTPEEIAPSSTVDQTIFLIIAVVINLGMIIFCVYSNYSFVKLRIKLKDRMVDTSS